MVRGGMGGVGVGKGLRGDGLVERPFYAMWLLRCHLKRLQNINIYIIPLQTC